MASVAPRTPGENIKNLRTWNLRLRCVNGVRFRQESCRKELARSALIEMDENKEPEAIEMCAPPIYGENMEGPVPKPISLRRIKREQREREERWFTANLASIQDVIKSGAIGSDNLILYALWWQLERWLKDLIRLEMMAAYGTEWSSRIRIPEERRAKQTPANAYMPSTDDSNPLAYCDWGDVETITSEQWTLIEYALLPQTRWKGRINELRSVRHRIGHCRQPHSDDLSRVRQALRDLTPGARQALSSYSRLHFLSPEDAALYERWDRRSPSHDGLIEHLASQYDITCRLQTSMRPWSLQATLLHLQWRSRKWPLDFGRVKDLLGIMGPEECGPLIHLNIRAPYAAEAVFALHDRPAAEAAVELWLGEIATLHTPFSTADDLLDWPRHESLDYRVRVDDYFAHAADAARAGPFTVASV